MMEIYVIDTETTGLDGYPDDYIVELAICKVDTEKKTVEKIFESIVGHDVDSWEHWQRNAWIFGNSDLKLEDVNNGPLQEDIVKKVRKILKNKYVTSFNTGYDFTKFLCYDPWNLDEVVRDICNCIMMEATPVCAIEGYYDDYKWPRLEEAYSMLCNGNPAKIEDQSHRAIDDTLMASHVLLSLLDSKSYYLPSIQSLTSKEEK